MSGTNPLPPVGNYFRRVADRAKGFKLTKFDAAFTTICALEGVGLKTGLLQRFLLDCYKISPGLGASLGVVTICTLYFGIGSVGSVVTATLDMLAGTHTYYDSLERFINSKYRPWL